MIIRRALLLVLCSVPMGIRASAETLHDPTRPVDTPHPQAGGDGGWQLNATRITPSQRSAVINGSRVREGEEINGARVLHIRHAQVQIATPDGITTLRLLPAEVIKIR